MRSALLALLVMACTTDDGVHRTEKCDAQAWDQAGFPQMDVCQAPCVEPPARGAGYNCSERFSFEGVYGYCETIAYGGPSRSVSVHAEFVECE